VELYDKEDIDEAIKIIVQIDGIDNSTDLVAYLADETAIQTKYDENKVPADIKYAKIKAYYRDKKAQLALKDADRTARTAAIAEVNNL